MKHIEYKGRISKTIQAIRYASLFPKENRASPAKVQGLSELKLVKLYAAMAEDKPVHSGGRIYGPRRTHDSTLFRGRSRSEVEFIPPPWYKKGIL